MGMEVDGMQWFPHWSTLNENCYYVPAHCIVSFSLIRAIKSSSNDVHIGKVR